MRSEEQTIKYLNKKGWSTDHLDSLEIINLEMLVDGLLDDHFYEKRDLKRYFLLREVFESEEKHEN